MLGPFDARCPHCGTDYGDRDDAYAERDRAHADFQRMRDLHDAIKRERDALLARVGELERAAAWKPSEVWREEVADEVAEQIAAWLDGLKNTNRHAECDDTADDLECLAADIRSGAWRAVREGE